MNYHKLTEVYLHMLQNDYAFIINRNLLKIILIDIAYTLTPDDNFNKGLVLISLSPYDEESDEDFDDDDDDKKKK